MENNGKNNHFMEIDGSSTPDFALDLLSILADYLDASISTKPFLSENGLKIVL